MLSVLNCAVPPVLRFDQEDYTVIINSPVQMSCEATGLPPPNVTWTKGGIELTGNETNGAHLLSNGALRIASVQREDAGHYECVASNIAGRASRLVTLNVHGQYALY
jgi:hemicentin